MPKPTPKGTTAPPFTFARQFTAPPFFVGIEDAKLKSKLLLDAVQRNRKTADVAQPKKRTAPAGKRLKTGKKR